MSDQTGAQSLERAFGLIDILAEAAEELPLQQVAALSGLHKSTVHRLLTALVNLGYVKTGDGKYALTLKMFEVGSAVLNRLDIISVARPHLERLRDAAKETIHLVTLDGSDIVYVQKLEYAQSAYQMASRIGMRRAAYCTAAGKSMLSTMSDREVAQVWACSEVRPYTPKTVTELPALYSQLDSTRRTMTAYDDEENEPGTRCVASPIRDYTGSARYAISVSVPLFRMDDETVERLAVMVRETALDISAELGYKPRA